MSTVLAAIDNSGQARSVLAVARAVARAFGADVEAVHVTTDGHQSATASADMAGVPLRLVSGDPVEQLVAAASADDVLVVVVGLRDHSAGPRPGGHTVLAVAERTGTPVVVVPPEVDADRAISTILVAVAGDPAETAALRRSVELAEETDLELVVVHVDEEIPRFTDQVQHEVDAYAEEFVARRGPDLRGIRLELRLGAAADEILAAVETERPGLVAVGWPRTGPSDHGDVAREVLAHCRVPVLLVGRTGPV
jgi:nucleotide-binding universal stress UspA family protein